MTRKQIARANFLDALALYRLALRSHDTGVIVACSVRVYLARANVPRRWHAAIGRAYRTNGAE